VAFAKVNPIKFAKVSPIKVVVDNVNDSIFEVKADKH